jgi:hypothetical protein
MQTAEIGKRRMVCMMAPTPYQSTPFPEAILLIPSYKLFGTPRFFNEGPLSYSGLGDFKGKVATGRSN